MTLNLTLPVQQHTDFSPRITVVGVGGGGTNAVNNMIAMGLDGVDFVVANTDAQSLVHSKAEKRVQLGPHLTQGLGAGAKAEIGRAAAEEATDEIARHLDGAHMVFVTAGMGGGTGTGAAPVIARMARERGVLTVGVVTKPFDFEGPKRKRAAEQGVEELQAVVDTLIVVPNQNLFRMATERTTFAEAFKMADNVLYMGVRGVTDLMVNPGIVNLDFADIRTVMAEMGKAMMGTGESEEEDRATKAAEAAISNPLLDDTSMRGAKGVLINITGGLDMTLYEVDEAANRIRKEVDEDANIIFGSSVDENMNGRIRVSVVATGIDVAQPAQLPAEKPRLVAVGQQQAATAGRAPGAAMGAPNMAGGIVPPGGFRRATVGQPAVLRSAAATTAPSHQPMQGQVAAQAQQPPAAMMSQPVVTSQAAPALQEMDYEPELLPQHAPNPMAPPMNAAPAANPFGGPVAPPAAAEPARRPGMAPARGMAPPAAAPSLAGSLFKRATGLMKRNLGDHGHEPAPVAPRVEQPPVAPRPQARAAHQDEIGLEIPTFLRRQSN